MPDYRVQVFDMAGASFAPGNLIAEYENAANIGFGEYLNDVPEIFFTIPQDDPKVILLRTHRNKAHIKVFRNADLVAGGVLGEWSSTERDAVFYGYGYSALFHLVTSDWNVAYTSAQINTIVSDAFTRAKSGLTDTLSGWLTQGTIEAPVTTSGGGTPIVLPSYRMFFKRTLRLFQEMAAIAVGDTTNVVAFEVTPAGVFNFWKNLGSDVTETFEYGDNLRGFEEGSIPILRRNDLNGVGINPNDITLRANVTDSADITANGRRMEPLFFPWVRDSLELDRVLKLRRERATRDVVDLQLDAFANTLTIPRSTGATWGLGDRVNVKIPRGVTNVASREMVTGYQVLYVRDSEYVRVLVQERPGT